MAGVKGRSGRKSLSNEQYKLSTIEECWKIVRQAINDETLPFQFRAELAAKHTVKSVPQELVGEMNHTVTEMPELLRDNNRVEPFLIGTPINGESV